MFQTVFLQPFAALMLRYNRNSRFVEQVVGRLVEQVLERKTVQIREKRLHRAAEYARQPAGRCNQAFVVFAHALDQLHRFEVADNRADVDAVGRCGKPQAAAFSAHTVEEAAFDQRGNDLHQMAFGNAVGYGDGTDVDQRIVVDGSVDKDAQPVVRMLCQIHDFLGMDRYSYRYGLSFTENTLMVETLSVGAVECSLSAAVCRLKHPRYCLIICYCNLNL